MNAFTGPWYGYGYYGYSFEYKSSITIAGWPLLHICGGVDPQTMTLRVAKGVIAIGNIAIGGLACGLITIGGVAIAPAAIDALRCDPVLLDAAGRWLGPLRLPPSCR